MELTAKPSLYRPLAIPSLQKQVHGWGRRDKRSPSMASMHEIFDDMSLNVSAFLQVRLQLRSQVVLRGVQPGHGRKNQSRLAASR
jgi:predicted NodU family carbamoyl transferase